MFLNKKIIRNREPKKSESSWRDPKQRFLSTSVGRSLFDDDDDEDDDDDDDVGDVEAERTRVRMMTKVLRL